PMDTSMGLTPAAGLVMSTRSGDLDPGLFSFLADSEHMTATQFNHMVNRESGLLGLSETSADMHDLLAQSAEDLRANEAVALFCYQAKKCIGAYAAAIGGLNTLVFSGGIGENSAEIRARICEDLEFLGIQLDADLNAANAAIISSSQSTVEIRVIPTDEEWMMAHNACEVLNPITKKESHDEKFEPKIGDPSPAT
ncbi:MAG: acetate/propionate family kinase, partial [Methylophilaceae bacterium]|nr:acetate/propionate family kinase [Methylophilaceae bacterium]